MLDITMIHLAAQDSPANRPSITLYATPAIIPMRKTSYMEINTRLTPNSKYANSTTMLLPAGIDDVALKNMASAW